jgi:hypothetical protein
LKLDYSYLESAPDLSSEADFVHKPHTRRAKIGIYAALEGLSLMGDSVVLPVPKPKGVFQVLHMVRGKQTDQAEESKQPKLAVNG